MDDDNMTTEYLGIFDSNNATEPSPEHGLACLPWKPLQGGLFQLSQLLFLLGYCAPVSGFAAVFVMHLLIALAFILMAVWGWVYHCALDVFMWCMTLTLLNLCHAGYAGYRIRPAKLTQEEKDLFLRVFKPFGVPMHTYQQLCRLGKIYSLKIGEHYATEKRTGSNRLGMIIYGKVKVFHQGQFLHHISESEFLDSTEWQSFSSESDVFQVTMTASSYCRYIIWPRESLLEALTSEPYLQCVFNNLIGNDIANKLGQLNERNSVKGAPKPDIRLPNVYQRPANRYNMKGQSGTVAVCGAAIPMGLTGFR
ncbi:popeye domain-containing protein 3-like isoform X2 [Anneissia japonica]|uniref:popeye domain-containing protein 3-like isoform X2 n=1 Tax=Anneissia japonica TaxID=1529436 RepID=UPI001425AFE3|nr:popeye domain-containing protein 3-like isoform X2 [Anneissia japonica]